MRIHTEPALFYLIQISANHSTQDRKTITTFLEQEIAKAEKVDRRSFDMEKLI